MNEQAKLSAWFLSQLGVSEEPPGSNSVIYNELYYGRPVSGDSYPWCAAFIWAGFSACGLSGLYLGGGKSAYCPYILDYARKSGCLASAPYREGDLLLYDNEGSGLPGHIGYCLGSSGGRLRAVEGNLNNKVGIIYRSEAEILGAYRPRYSNAAPPDIPDYPALPDKPPFSGETIFPEPEEGDYASAGDLVSIRPGANYYDGKKIPDWVLQKRWYVESVKGKRAVINESDCGNYRIMSALELCWLIPLKREESTDGLEYTVKSGDSLWKISRRMLGAGSRYREIMELNELESELIFPGQKLKIPERGKNE